MVDEPKITLKVKLDNIFQMISNKVTSWSQTPSNDKYPSEKLVKDSLDSKQVTLVSGINIKTVNNESILGNGNIEISVGENYGTFAELQTIINNAQSGDTIILDKNYKNDGSSIVDGIGIEIHKDLTIIGNGHIIDGNHLSSIFSTDYTTLTFENITLMNGNGGAIYGVNLNLINCNFINNVGAYFGGAINGNGDIYIAGCNFINNSVDDGDGGAIFCFSNNMTVTNSTFINNNANGVGGAISLSVYNNSLFNISDCVFIDNVATNNGGGIFAYIGSTSGENLKVYNCTFENSTLYNTTNVDYLTSHQDITEKEDKSNKTSSWNSTTNDTRYPTEKLVKDSLDNKANSSHTHTTSEITNFPSLNDYVNKTDMSLDSDFLENFLQTLIDYGKTNDKEWINL